MMERNASSALKIFIVCIISFQTVIEAFRFPINTTPTLRNQFPTSSLTKTLPFSIHPNNDRVNVLLKSTKSSSTSGEESYQLDPKQLDFTMGYLNKHHTDLLISFAQAFSELGTKQSKKNAFSGGSYNINSAELVGIDMSQNTITLDVMVQERGKPESSERVIVPLGANPVEGTQRNFKSQPKLPKLPSNRTQKAIFHLIRQMNRLCIIVNQSSVTGKLIQLGVQIGGDESPMGFLKKDMFLNQVPHNRYVRQYFYELASQATLEAVIQCSNRNISNRMLLTCLFPELNTSMDSYRIGTLLEMVRHVAIALAEQNLRVRICVQESMGVGIFTGLPKSLSGVSTLLQRMDWQAGPGEDNEGMLGNYINFGGIGAHHVVNAHTEKRLETKIKIDDETGEKVEVNERVEVEVEQDDIYILICPQSMVGVESSIMQPLQEMVEAAGDRPVILINPDLEDKRSSQGQQSVRGRKDRLDFANSFAPIFHFQNIYYSGTSYFPILGALCKLSPLEPWVAYQRRDFIKASGVEDISEMYIPCLSSEMKPEGEDILKAFDQ